MSNLIEPHTNYESHFGIPTTANTQIEADFREAVKLLEEAIMLVSPVWNLHRRIDHFINDHQDIITKGA